MNTTVEWIGLNLDNPVVLASLTPISHKRIKEHVDYYIRAAQAGAGAIVLESCVPRMFDNKDMVFTQHDLLPFETGLTPQQYMGFAILGSPYPNLSSIKYEQELAKHLRKHISIPIIGSIITNFSEKNEIVKSAKMLANAGIDALELNFSCPNIALFNANKNCCPPIDIIKTIKQITGLNISLKITPSFGQSSLIDSKIYEHIDGITYANAHLGLVPPNINDPLSNPFGRGKQWTYSGIYGPFERLLTYKEIAHFKKNPLLKKLPLSAAGGIVHEKHVIEALLLGANNVQLSSGILWKSFKLINSSIELIKNFMQQHGFLTINEFRGISLKNIADSSKSLADYHVSASTWSTNQRKTVKITNKCVKCYECLNNACLAINKDSEGNVYVNKELCSGCGWCETLCNHAGSIERE